MAFHNQSGFTLLNMLISLGVLLLILPFFPIIFQIVSSPTSSEAELDFSVHQFFMFVRDEVYQAKQIEISQSNLVFHQYDGELVSIQKYGSLIRRQLNYQGHEPLIYGVEEVTYQHVQNGIKIIIQMTGGKIYERRFTAYRSLEAI